MSVLKSWKKTMSKEKQASSSFFNSQSDSFKALLGTISKRKVKVSSRKTLNQPEEVSEAVTFFDFDAVSFSP